MMAALSQDSPIIIAAGGTGGHLFPAQALAVELRRRARRVVLVTDDRGLKWHDQFPDTEFHRTISGTVTQSGVLARSIGLAKLVLGTVQALYLLFLKRPRVVIGFGGYPSLPTMFAAILRRDPTFVHEQNGVMGRANRLIASRVDQIALTFPDPIGLKPALREKSEITGNPVRQSVVDMRDVPYPHMAPEGPFNLLIFGGSQGAKVFSDVVPKAVAALPSDVRDTFRITQQCREEEKSQVETAYRAMNVRATVRPFFDDLPRRMAEAHLVVCRSGASTVCELSVIGRPALLVPLPGAIDGDQSANAATLVKAGGAWLIQESDFTADDLTEKLVQLYRAPERLQTAADAARAQGRPDAAKQLADTVERLANYTTATLVAKGVA